MRFDPSDPTEYADFKKDRVVLIHELGHVVAWFCHGEGVGRLRLERKNKLLWPQVILAFREQRDANTDRDAEVMAERVLAGESAARRAVGMPRDEICFGRWVIDRNFNVGSVAPHLRDEYDEERVLKIAWAYGRNGWYEWIAKRLKSASVRVDDNWAVIDRMASWIKPRVPMTTGQVCCVPGRELIKEMQRLGVRTAQEPAIEIVEQPGGSLVRSPCEGRRRRRGWRFWARLVKLLGSE